MRRNGKKGISVIELLVGIAILGFIAAVTLGYSMRSKGQWNIKNNAREIASSYHKMKQNAVSHNRPIWVNYQQEGYQYRYWSNGDSKWIPLSDAGLFTGENVSSVTLTTDVEFVVSSLGTILEAPVSKITDPSTLPGAGTKVIQLTSEGISDTAVVEITIYPYGGIKIKNDFKN